MLVLYGIQYPCEYIVCKDTSVTSSSRYTADPLRHDILRDVEDVVEREDNIILAMAREGK